jgi:hypothetical protein
LAIPRGAKLGISCNQVFSGASSKPGLLNCAAKNCTGDCPATLKHWLGDRDVLFLIDRRGEPLVLVRWGAWRRLAEPA